MNSSLTDSCLKQVTLPLPTSISSHPDRELDLAIADVNSYYSRALGLEQTVVEAVSMAAPTNRNSMQPWLGGKLSGRVLEVLGLTTSTGGKNPNQT
jgi:hypothetical protein